MKLISNIFFSVFTILLIGVFALFLLPSLPLEQNVELKIVESGSMEPNIMTGALVVVAPAKEYKMGDTITFNSRYGDVPTTHRIVNIELIEGQTYYTTKGDANEEADTAKVISRDIIGKVYFDVPYAGFILDFARQPIGFSCLIVLPALLIIFGEINKIWSEWRRLRQPKKLEENIFIPKTITAPQAEPTPALMLDIATPVRFQFNEKDYVLKIPAFKQPRQPRINRPGLAVLAVLALTGIGLINLHLISSTFSFSRDAELAASNTLIARALDFTAAEDTNSFVFEGTELQNGGATIVIEATPESGTLVYDVAVQEISGSGGLCDALMTDLSSPFSYSGKLPLLTGVEVEFTDPWMLPITLSGETSDFAGSSCVIDLVFIARHTDAFADNGYMDEERITLDFSVPIPPAPLLFEQTFSSLETGPELPIEEIVNDIPEEKPPVVSEPEAIPLKSSSTEAEITAE